MTDIKMMPLPDELRYRYGYMGQAEHDATVGNYARAVAKHNVKALLSLLGECYALAGADTDGDPPERHALDAVQAVRDLRKDYDEACEEMHGPDGYAARADQLQAELDNRWAQGVHTCHDKCQRIACVLRRDNKRLAEALRGLLALPIAEEELRHLDKGIGTATRNAAWLRALAALRDHDQEGKDAT